VNRKSRQKKIFQERLRTEIPKRKRPPRAISPAPFQGLDVLPGSVKEATAPVLVMVTFEVPEVDPAAMVMGEPTVQVGGSVAPVGEVVTVHALSVMVPV
jgi:hypothetical protein